MLLERGQATFLRWSELFDTSYASKQPRADNLLWSKSFQNALYAREMRVARTTLPIAFDTLRIQQGVSEVLIKAEELWREALECDERAEQIRGPFIKQQLIEIA